MRSGVLMLITLFAAVQSGFAGYEQVFSSLDLTRPGLEKVRAAVAAGDNTTAAAELKAYFRARRQPVFITDRETRPAKDPGFKTAAADKVLAREYSFVGKPATLTHDIDWNADPLKDIEWPIELNRHYTWVELARAYWRTYDEKYAEDLAYQIDDWLNENPRPATPRDAKWTWRTLECGIRLAGSWPEVFFRALDSDRFTPELMCRMLESFRQQTDYLMQFHGGGNWLVCEKSGVVTVGVVFPEFKDAPTWLATAVAVLDKELTAQVYPDGAQIELTPHYHSATLNSFRTAFDIATRNGISLPPDYRRNMERMYEYLMYVVKPDGFIPMFNDSDHGNMKGWLRDGAQRFGRQDMLYLATGGKEGTPPAGPSHAFPWAGQYVMRSGWTASDVYLAFDAGPYGLGHQHEDKLQVDVWGYGQEMILDPGRFTYQGGKWRSHFLSTACHSTVLVNGKGQRRRSTPSTTWVAKQPLDNRWVSNAELDYAVGSYDDGYEGAPDVVHIRKVLFVRPQYFVVSDLLVTTAGAAAECEATCQFQLARPGAPLDAPTLAVHSVGKDANILVCPAAPDNLRVTQHEGEEDPPAGWIGWSLHAALKQPATLVCYVQKGQTPLTFDTLLFPYAGEQPPRIAVRRVPVMAGDAAVAPGGATAIEVAGDGWRDVVFLSHTAKRQVATFAGFSTDAEVAVLRFNDGPQPATIAVLGGNSVPPAPAAEPALPETALQVNRIAVTSEQPAAFTLRYGYAAGGGFLFETTPPAPATSATLSVQNLRRDVPYVYEALAQRDGAWRQLQRGTLTVPEPRAFDFEDGTLQDWGGPGARLTGGCRGSTGALHVEDAPTSDVSYLTVSRVNRITVTPRFSIRFAWRTPMPEGGKYFYVKLTLHAEDGKDWAAYFAAAPAADWQEANVAVTSFKIDVQQDPDAGKPMPAGLRVTQIAFTLRKDVTPQPVAPCLEIDDLTVQP